MTRKEHERSNFQINVVRFGVLFKTQVHINLPFFSRMRIAKVAKPHHWAVLTFKRDQDYVLEVDVLVACLCCVLRHVWR